MKKRTKWDKLRLSIDIGVVIMGILFVVSLDVSEPEVNAYDNYDLTTYACLDIALETQEWYSLNGINTTVMVGCFNDSLCHAWLEDSTGNKLIGYVPEWEYEEIYTLKEVTEVYDL